MIHNGLSDRERTSSRIVLELNAATDYHAANHSLTGRVEYEKDSDYRIAVYFRDSVSLQRESERTMKRGVTFENVREIAQTLPSAEESTSYGTPAFKVKGKLFARQHQDGESLVIAVDFAARGELMNAAPEKFYITDHYLNYPWMLVRMKQVNKDELRDLLMGAWRRVGGKTLVQNMGERS